MEIYRVAFIGHRELNDPFALRDQIEEIAKDLLRQKEYVEFYMGRNGEFDEMAASAIKCVRKSVGTYNHSLTLVLPYSVKDEPYYADYYDNIMYPVPPDTHFKAAITKRNEWLVENADLLISFVKHESGGAYQTQKYAQKLGVEVINLAIKREE